MKPLALKRGDTIGVVSPASPVRADQCEFMFRLLENEGFRVKTYPGTFETGPYLTGPDEDRAAELTLAMHDPQTSAVLCARGGYGCSRLIPHLDPDGLATSRKLLMGFSDITVLHALLNSRGLPTAHTPMALTLNTPRSQDYVYDSFRAILWNQDPMIEHAPNGATVVGGVVEGKVVGGCLILLADLIGTPEQVDMTDKIVVIEGVDDPPHRVDAMFTHLINSNSITRAAGIVIGEMTRTDSPQRLDVGIGGMPWRDIVRDRLEPLGIPCIIDFPFGHSANMLSLPLGISARLDAGAGTLTYTESLCEP